MKYFKIECGNGSCGCNEEWLIESEKEPNPYDILGMYSYAEGYAGQENDLDDYDDPNEYWEMYEQDIFDNMHWEEIEEEEFFYLRDFECWEVR